MKIYQKSVAKNKRGVRKINKEFKELLNDFRKLKLPEEKYAIYGSGPLAIRGIRKAKDLDVIVTKRMFQKLKEKYLENYEKDLKKRFKEKLKIRKIEIYPTDAWRPKFEDLNRAIKKAETIQGLKFIRLKDLIKFKEKMGRPKDFRDIKLIKKYLNSIKN